MPRRKRIAYSFILEFFFIVGDVTFKIGGFVLKVILHFRRRFVRRKSHTIFSPFSFRSKLKYFAIGTIFSFFFLFLPLTVVVAIQTLPNPSALGLEQFPQTTKIFDRHGTLLYQIYATQNRTIVPLSDIPQDLQYATIAIEDKNFYKNPGFDIAAIIRATISDIQGHHVQGASTITQQLIKSSLLSSEISFKRKVEEVFLSFWAEKLFSKSQILQMYFNQVPYGGTAWGVEAASETYFGQHVKDLDLAESAFLAGLPQAPTSYSPFSSTGRWTSGPGTPSPLWKQRQLDVLERMKELNYITPTQEKEATSETLSFISPQVPLKAPHFVMYVKDLLEKRYGIGLVEKGGLSVFTTLDIPIQDMAQQTVADEVDKDAYLQLSNGAVLVTSPNTGDILAMVGSKNYFDSDIDGNVNLTTSLRQPGSSIKVVTYASAMSHGFTAATILDDSPVVYRNDWETYAPVNYDGRFHGRVSLRIALANSFNIPAVKTLNSISIPAFVDLGKQMGLSHLQDASHYGLSATLGAVDATMLDMATLYGTLAHGGQKVDLNPILKITDSKGDVLEQKGNVQPIRVLDPGIPFILSDILSDNAARSMEFGSNSPLFIPGHTIAVKTGTSDNKRDNWTFGFTPVLPGNKQYLVSVWVGNNDNSPMSQDLASGITGAAPIWHTIMSNLVNNQADVKFSQPDNVISKSCIGRNEYFLKGTENSVSCTYMPQLIPTVKP